MAKPARLIYPISLVGTSTQKIMIENEAYASKVSQGDVVRMAVDAYFGLIDGEVPEGDAPPSPVNRLRHAAGA